MTFAEYDRIMKEHGIGELFFRYHDQEYFIFIQIQGLNMIYHLHCGKKTAHYDDFDKLAHANIFDGKCLKDIWNDIQILSIDEVSEQDYDVESCSFDYVRFIRDQGDLQWSYSLGVKKSFLLQYKYALIGVLVFLVPLMVFPIFQLSDWNILILFGGCAVISLMVAAIALWKNKLDVNYMITDKKIFTYNGLQFTTTYDNVKKVKLKKSIFCKNIGTIQLYPKKGWAINYSLEWIPDPEKVYALIQENIRKQSE